MILAIKKSKKLTVIYGLTIVCLVLFGSVATLSTHYKARADASASNFQPGRIIDDAVFTNYNTLSTSLIQAFLNSKVSTCDTNGTQPASEYGSSLTHAQYAASRGWASPPYTCLKDYVDNGISSAQIIYNVAQQYQINPQVLIVLLQKEQGLVTDTWPLSTQYKTATGYGCPDTSVCDSQYYGLTNQLNQSGKMFRAIMNASPAWYTPYVMGNNYIKWHPDSWNSTTNSWQNICGGTTINIQNRATQALYNYTPYQPNQASLNAGYGTGDSCSSYGNRNFYLYFNDWFGNTIGPDNFWQLQSLNVYSDQAHTTPARTNGDEIFLLPGQKAYINVSAMNMGRTIWNQSVTRLGTYSPIDYASPFSDSSWMANYRIVNQTETSVAPYQTATFNFSVTAPLNPSFYVERYNMVSEGLTWFNDANLRLYITVMTQDNSVPAPTTIIKPGQAINIGDEIVSSDKHTILKLQNNGDLELFTNFRKTWASNTYNSTVKQVVLQNDGNLVMYSSNGSAVWSSGTYNSGSTQINIQSDGALVMYNSNNSVIWSSNTATQDQTGLINRKLNNGLTLFPGQTIITPDRKYKLILQYDGNLVIYSPQKAIWDSKTYGRNPGSLTMQLDGNLVLVDSSGSPIWSSYTAGRGASSLLMQQDGNLVIYSQSNSNATWSSNTTNLQ